MYSTIRAKWATLTARLTTCRVRSRIANFFIMTNTLEAVTIYLRNEDRYFEVQPVAMQKVKRYPVYVMGKKHFLKWCTIIETEHDTYYTWESTIHWVDVEWSGMPEGAKVYNAI